MDHTTLYNYKKMPNTNFTASSSTKPRLAKLRNNMITMPLITNTGIVTTYFGSLFLEGAVL